MAGEVADGYLIHPFNSPASVAGTTLPALDRGLASAGRTRADLEICHQFIVGTGRDDTELAAARSAVRTMLAFYGSTAAYRPVLDAEGYGHLQPELRDRTRAGLWAELAEAIPDGLIDRIAIVGAPEQVAEAIRERAGGLADRVALCFPGPPAAEATAAILRHLRTSLAPSGGEGERLAGALPHAEPDVHR